MSELMVLTPVLYKYTGWSRIIGISGDMYGFINILDPGFSEFGIDCFNLITNLELIIQYSLIVFN